MNFLEAANALKTGEKVRRSGWSEGEHLYTDMDNIYIIFLEEGNSIDYEWLTSDIANYLADDWEVLKDG